MAQANVHGVHINYEVIGDKGPWMALSPGGRRPLGIVKSLAQRMAGAGYRVLVHDRRNCGASDVSIDGEESEYEIWADDLHALLAQLGGLPAIVGGSSSGCRLSLLFALRHPEAVRALLLWRVTGGPFAATRLAEQYYGQFIAAAERGGMQAVCETEHFRERIEARAANRDRLMAMDAARFIAVMSRWSRYFLSGADLPVIGCTAQDLGSIRVPSFIVPGNDLVHGLATGRAAHRLIPGSEYFELLTDQRDIDLVPLEEWDEREDELAQRFAAFLTRRLAPARA